MEAWESGDLGTYCCYQVLSMLLVVDYFVITDEWVLGRTACVNSVIS